MGGPGAVRKYWTWWARLMLQNPHETAWVTSTFWVPSVGGFALAMWAIWKSVAYDPEVRIRPHKRAWHQSERRIANATKYRHGAFAWYYKMVCPQRYRYVIQELENGFEELEIPKE